MILAGQTLYVLEVQPAAYAALAANEAEKPPINILEIQAVGSFDAFTWAERNGIF